MIYDIGDVSKERIVEAVCATRGYQEKVGNPQMPNLMTEDNPESKEDFANRMVEKNILSEVENYEKDLIQKDAIKDYDVNVVSEKLSTIKEGVLNATRKNWRNVRH